MCKKDDEALRLLGEVVKSQGERTDLDNNVNEVSRSSGNSKSYTLDRLAREDAELYEKVVAEEMNRLRSTVKDLLNPDAAGHGGDRKSEEAQDQVDNVNSKKGGNSDSYALRRLKRDAHGLTRSVDFLILEVDGTSPPARADLLCMVARRRSDGHVPTRTG